ncbi:MAG: PEGA domain-containing protein [Terriglobales bacterium]
MTTTPLAPSIELKPGASREEIETGLGKPTQAIAFGNKTWLTYSGLVAVLEDGKLTSVERNEQAFGNLSLTAEKGAEIYIDGELAGTTPTTLRVPTGSHKVELKVAGKNVWEQQVHVFPGADVNLKPAVAGQ